MSSSAIATVWQRWHTFTAANTPQLTDILQGPVEAADLAEFSAFGMPLPEELIESLKIHNGQDADCADDFLAGGGRLLSAAEMLEHHRMLREALGELPPTEDDDLPPLTGIGPVRTLNVSERWLPIAEFNGDVTWFLDFDPLPAGQVGQVIRVDLESSEWLVCAESYAQFMDGYVCALEQERIKIEDGNLESVDFWPPIERLPYLADTVLDSSRVLEVGRSGRWDIASRLLTRLSDSPESFRHRVAANAEFQKGNYAKAREALETLRTLDQEVDEDRWLMLDVLEAQERRPALMVELDTQIAKAPNSRLYGRRADLHREIATNPERKGTTAQLLEWLSCPAGQQHRAVCLERAIADYRRARAEQDRDQWRLAEGECLLDMQRWEEAEVLFEETLGRIQAGLGNEEPEEWSPAAFRRESAEQGLRRARTQDEGEDEAMLEDVESLLATLGDGGQLDGAEELRSVRDTFERLRSDESREKAERNADVGRLERDAKHIAQQIVARHVDTPERLASFPVERLDRKARKYYDQARDQLIALGFEHMGDAEPLNHSESTGNRVMIRVMRAADRLTIAAVWRLAGPFSVIEAVELESLLEDHSVLLSNNTGAANPFAAPPKIAQQSLPQGCLMSLLVDTHARRLRDNAIAAVPILDMDDVVELQEQQRLIKREHAREQGWVSDAELRGLLGGSYRELAPRVRELLQEMH